jgi:outer membrane lipoprotein SlyB
MGIHSTAVAVALAAAACAGGCAAPKSANVYGAGDAMREQSVRMATVESVREVTLDRGQSGVGSGAGAVVGGVAGSSVGEGRGSIVGAVVGAVAGGIAGQAIENRSSQVPALEVTVRLDSGDMRALVQEADGQAFRPGDRVRLLSSGGNTRVSH